MWSSENMAKADVAHQCQKVGILVSENGDKILTVPTATLLLKNFCPPQQNLTTILTKHTSAFTGNKQKGKYLAYCYKLTHLLVGGASSAFLFSIQRAVR